MSDEDMLAKWEAFHGSKAARDSRLENEDWHSMIVGFFVALGASVKHAYELHDACVARDMF